MITVRDDALATSRFVLPQSITSSANFTSILLVDLDQDDSATLFRNLVGETVDDNSLAEVWKITGGNPLFIREYASSGSREGGATVS